MLFIAELSQLHSSNWKMIPHFKYKRLDLQFWKNNQIITINKGSRGDGEKKRRRMKRPDQMSWRIRGDSQSSDGMRVFRLSSTLFWTHHRKTHHRWTVTVHSGGTGEMLSCNTISLFDRSAVPTVIQLCGASSDDHSEMNVSCADVSM